MTRIRPYYDIMYLGDGDRCSH